MWLSADDITERFVQSTIRGESVNIRLRKILVAYIDAKIFEETIETNMMGTKIELTTFTRRWMRRLIFELFEHFTLVKDGIVFRLNL